MRAAERAGFGKVIASYEELDFVPFDPVIKRVEATVRTPQGEVIRAIKVSFDSIEEICECTESNPPYHFLSFHSIPVPPPLFEPGILCFSFRFPSHTFALLLSRSLSLFLSL